MVLTASDLPSPVAITCPDLVRVLAPITSMLSGKWAEDTLVDLWKTGTPVPDPNPSDEYIEASKRWQSGAPYDPRTDIWTRRWIMPDALAGWLSEVFDAIGSPISPRQAYNIMSGRPDYGI